MPIELSVPASKPQKPPAGVARFQSMPRITVPNSGAMKKLNNCLHVIHNAGELHHEIGRPDAHQHAQHSAQFADIDVMMIVSVFLDHRAVNVVGPNRGETRSRCLPYRT